MKLMRLSMYVLGALWLVPFIWVFLTSFQPRETIGSGLFQFTYTLDNYTSAWSGAPFLQYYLNTTIIVLGILSVQLFTATLAAYVFAKMEFKGKEILFVLFLVQLMVPNEALIVPNFQIISDFSLIDTKLAVMMPYFMTALGVFLLRQQFKSIPAELEEAARIDGCGPLRIITKIYLPLSVPTYVAFSLVSVSTHWNNFLWPLIVTNSEKNRPITVGLSLFSGSYETGAQFAVLTAATIIVVAPLLLAFLIFQRQFMNSFMQTGIK
ncbi:carbohydrate ABC transporter permease [Evansella tamaricis]|uniref:Carbohydrate ABC transporter permease n=1 Tax=Evansella tamaricis TaxID=2069301 RepID=A0ABS6JEB0_9BACI|nr:carbohydrate ABC transporter permease [Evansella tamaricis]MBU9710678.1 carbohydrate ABC transporter permease [Evansella tamaricis]